MIMRIDALNYSDTVGGAARAAYRLHHALLEQGIESRLIVNQKTLSEPEIKGPDSRFDYWRNRVSSKISRLVMKLLRTKSYLYHSPACIPSYHSEKLNASNADLVHLHWTNGEMVSIPDLARIKKPLIWTMHDMWGFCGAEHYTEDFRWRDGYAVSNRPPYESGLDINRWTWLRKRKNWIKPIQIVTPSHWLAEQIRASKLMKDWPVQVIANPINTEQWQPHEKHKARQELNLPQDKPLLLFGALGGGGDPRKGFDLMMQSLVLLKPRMPNLELVIFGQNKPENPMDYGFKTYYVGHISDDLQLQTLYSAADVMVVPSRQEAFGQTASEALACGCPVAAFAVTGLLDVVEHQKSGYLAKPYDVTDLASGIEWLFKHQKESNILREQARKRAVDYFSYPVIAQQYTTLYQKVIDEHS
jgi:glycosyltransferase involved in cell wall biosynthesis